MGVRKIWLKIIVLHVMRENAFWSKINPEWNFTVIPTRNKKDL
jgi:hypothetical protein